MSVPQTKYLLFIPNNKIIFVVLYSVFTSVLTAGTCQCCGKITNVNHLLYFVWIKTKQQGGIGTETIETECGNILLMIPFYRFTFYYWSELSVSKEGNHDQLWFNH